MGWNDSENLISERNQPMKRDTTLPHLNDPFIPATQARKYLGDIDAKTQAEWVARGILPEPIRITKRFLGWRLSTLDAVLERAAKEGGAE